MLRPDFLIQLPNSNGVCEGRIADIKTVSCGAPSWYKAGKERGVEKRAKLVGKEYLAKARAMDKEGGVGEGDIGPG